MSDEMLRVDFAAMRAASDNIASAVRTLDEQLSQLERDAAPLVAAWDGAARAAYDERQAAWRRAAGDLAAMLGDIRRALDESAHDYAAAEQRNVRLFQ
ncbi:MAG TPA: WXG100 family type VII secretion target [Micromonosporaceae bacterium]|nr:WXG100 family type VII secretion target [Micromonosporaceae bacterium]